MTDIMRQLRPHRPRLVRAAEAVFKGISDRDKKLKSQLNHLIAVCNSASCHEEIRLYLRYQASRENPPIKPPTLVDTILGELQKVFDADPPITDVDLQIAAWRLYAVYLARAFTYADKSSAAGSANRSHDPSHPHAPQPRGRR